MIPFLKQPVFQESLRPSFCGSWSGGEFFADWLNLKPGVMKLNAAPILEGYNQFHESLRGKFAMSTHSKWSETPILGVLMKFGTFFDTMNQLEHSKKNILVCQEQWKYWDRLCSGISCLDYIHLYFSCKE